MVSDHPLLQQYMQSEAPLPIHMDGGVMPPRTSSSQPCVLLTLASPVSSGRQ